MRYHGLVHDVITMNLLISAHDKGLQPERAMSVF